MSKSKETIEIEFSKAIAQADEIEKIASSLLLVASTLSGSEMAKLEGFWKGSNANLICMKWRALSKDMFEAAQNFTQISKSIRVTADLVYKAEKAAMYLAYY